MFPFEGLMAEVCYQQSGVACWKMAITETANLEDRCVQAEMETLSKALVFTFLYSRHLSFKEPVHY